MSRAAVLLCGIRCVALLYGCAFFRMMQPAPVMADIFLLGVATCCPMYLQYKCATQRCIILVLQPGFKKKNKKFLRCYN